MPDATEVDLQQLAIKRDARGSSDFAPKRRVVSRYVLPGMLTIGFVAVLSWAARDTWLPRQQVTVVPVLVSLAEIQTAGTPLFKAAGWIEPRPTPIRVAALAPGVVEELLVVEDQFVTAGQPVAHLVKDDANLELNQAQAVQRLRAAELDEARANLAAAETSFNIPSHLELPLASADAALAAVETDLSNLPLQLQRAQARSRLASVDLESKIQLRDSLSGIVIEQAQSEFDTAQADVEEYQQRRPLLEQQRDALIRKRDAAAMLLDLKTDERQALAAAQAMLDAAAARLSEAEVAVAQAELLLDRMTISSPVSGRVLNLVAHPGSHVGVGRSQMDHRDANTVVTMYEPERLQIRVDVRFEDLPRVGGGQPVFIESPALPQPLVGEVLFLTGFANIQKNTLEVKVSLDSPPDLVKPEMLVDVTFLAAETDEPEDASPEEYRLYLPREVVHTDEAGAYVWLADIVEGVARRQPVEQGAVQTPAIIEIAGNLTAASRIISSGFDRLADGDRIEITGESTTIGSELVSPDVGTRTESQTEASDGAD